MHIVDTYQNLADQVKGKVVIIGNFDGVHKGHQALIDAAKTIADDQKSDIAVLTFEPHPRRLFQPDEPPGRVTPIVLKRERLKHEGIETLYEIPFDWDLASESYQDFIQNVLIDGIEAKHIVIGRDFRFGQMRQGSPDDIKASGLPVTILDKVSNGQGVIYSSSVIRQAIRHGNIDKANAMLGWNWEMQGEVVKGDQRGRELGYPTANMKLGDIIHPAYGIYAAWVRIGNENEWHKAAVNIGIRPMFEVPIAQVESHILDFDRDIYGAIIRVRPVRHLRSEAKFDSLDDLITQIDKDCAQVRAVLAR